jgi:hypothetical protein
MVLGDGFSREVMFAIQEMPEFTRILTEHFMSRRPVALYSH